jgi:hypothetical protein
MSVSEYKEAIKSLIDSTNNETLLKYWKKQLEWDFGNQNEIELSSEEWSLVQEGIAVSCTGFRYINILQFHKRSPD